MRVLTKTWWSPSVGRDKSITVLLPPAYSPTAAPLPVLYLLHGYGGDRTTWLRCTDLTEHAARHKMILVLPESGRSWLINDARGRRYEDYFVHEVVTYIDENFNTVTRRDGRGIAGFSMGGACALIHALRHGSLFSVVGSHSGAFEAPLREGDPYARFRGDRTLAIPTERDHQRVWGPAGSQTRRVYDPYTLLAARDPALSLQVYLDIGLDDYARIISMNRNMRDALASGSVPHLYCERAGGHDWTFVNSGLPTLLAFIRDRLAAG